MASNKAYRRFSVAFLVLLGSLLLLAALPNIYFDPLCCFPLFPRTDRPIPVVDARLQKTNCLLHGLPDYSALLLGSSRVEQFRQRDFLPMKTFNYALPSFYPDEAAEYLDLFLANNARLPRVVFLGLDFYGSNLHSHDKSNPPRYYIDACASLLAPLKAAMSRDTFKYSMQIAKGTPDLFMYDRHTLDKLTLHLDDEKSGLLFKQQMDIYRQKIYGDYLYNGRYATTLRRLRDGHPTVRFVVFTTPVSKELFSLLLNSGRFTDYERWLSEVVDVFGTVYNFMVLDKLTTNPGNFMDAHHLYPEKTAPLARIISGCPLPEDRGIGYVVTRQTLDTHLALLRRQAGQKQTPAQ